MEKSLIAITTDAQGASVVSARELHEFLEVRSRFADWFKNRVEKYSLIEGQDFVPVEGFSKNLEKGGRPEIDYALTLDTAKELAMVQNNEQGKAARQYFIDCEKQLRQVAAQPAPAVAPATDPLLLQILSTQSQLMAGQQAQLDQLRSDIAQIQAGHRPARSRPTLPGVRPPRTEPTHNAGLRSQINQQVNAYCVRRNTTPQEVYQYLYGRLQSVFGFDVYHLSRQSNESMLSVIERYGYLDRLYSLILSELAYIE